MRRIGKRGMEDKVWFLMFEIIAFAMVAIIIVFAVRGLVNNSSYWKKYYSTDLALMADLESINQGDFVMNYVLKGSNNNKYLSVFFLKDRKYDFLLKDDRVEVYDSPKTDSMRPTMFPYAPFKNADVYVNTVTADFLVLTKQKSVLALDRYVVDTATVCPSDDTSKDINTVKFSSISMDTQSTQFASSIAALLTVYGGQNTLTEATVIVAYEKDSPMTIYYSDDVKKLWSQKLACMLGKEYADKYPTNSYELKMYDEFLDQNTEFTTYINNPSRNPEEFWIILQISDAEVAIYPNIFAGVIRDTLIKFYE